MSQGLLIAGIPVRVRKNTWVRGPSRYQGQRMYLSENNLFDGSYAEARVWDCDLYFISAAEEDAIRTACPRGLDVEITGDLPDDTVQCTVDLGVTRLLKIVQGGTQSLHRVMTVHIEEVLTGI